MKEKELLLDTVPGFLVNPHYRIYRHALLQLILVLITLNVFWDTPDSIICSADRFWAWAGYYLIINLLIYTNIYCLLPRYLLKDKFSTYFLLSFVFILCAILLIGVLQSYFYQTDMPEIQLSPFIGGINLLSSLFSISLLLLGISSLLLFRYWIISGYRIDELEKMQLQSELVYLKNQINPHFLFNMLNNANIMVEDDPDVSATILTRLEEMLRYQLDDSIKDEVDLVADITFLERYLQLEQTRRDHFSYTISRPDYLTGIRIPPLLYITFVENAVKHNWVPSGHTFVNISFSLEKDRLVFVCKNSCSEKPVVAEKDGGLGLVNIQRRLDLLYGSAYRLEINKDKTEYKVRLEIRIDRLSGFNRPKHN